MIPLQEGETTHRVYLVDEIPKFGAGWRIVILVQSGPKWVYLRKTATGRAKRIRHSLWVEILKQSARMNNRSNHQG